MNILPCLLLALVMFFVGVFLGIAIGDEKTIDVPDVPLVEKVASEENASEQPEDFTVAGKPRKPTWKQRRRELEAAARTKRKQLEEWRD